MGDLVGSSTLDERYLLRELHERYKRDEIYTYMGDILIALNPFKPMSICSRENGQPYREMASLGALPPHIFGIADQTYQAMLRTRSNQCCVVSGESGAGKTESTKLLVRHTMDICRGGKPSLESKILSTNPMLEAFGNAKTVMNDNSSRFGKFIDLTFDDNGFVVGSSIAQYLLEKSRVVRHAPGERGYHVFYYIFAGMSDAQKGEHGLTVADDYRYLYESDGRATPFFPTDKQSFNQLSTDMTAVGFVADEQADILAVLAAVLHMGNLEFGVEEGSDTAFALNKNTLNQAAQLLAVDGSAMERAMIYKTAQAGRETITKTLNQEQAEESREAIAKALYARLFTHIVGRVNALLLQSSTDASSGSSIGILDIFGFENFRANSFEQLLINVANENLQHFFNQFIFQWEQDEYKREGIPWEQVTFEDNGPTIELLLGRMGILAVLDEESHFPKATDSTFLGKLQSQCAPAAKSGLLEFPKMGGNSFQTKHYAGSVQYTVTGFLEKNRDTVSSDFAELMKRSGRSLVRAVFSQEKPAAAPGAAGAGARGMPVTTKKDEKELTVASVFKNSLKMLMSKIYSATPHFVRCIKPNRGNAPGQWDDEFVSKQMRYTGILETIRIRKAGFPERMTFREFVERYKTFSFQASQALKHDEATCRDLLKRAQIDPGWKIGKTKVFLKLHQRDQLETAFSRIEKKVVRIQAWWRMHLAKRRTQRLRKLMEERKVANVDAAMQVVAQEEKAAAEEADRRAAGGAKREESADERETRQMDKDHVWFKSTVSRRQGELALQNKPPGVFLVRPSSEKGKYVLSFVTKDRTMIHYRVAKRHERWRIEGEYERFATLYQLVEFHKIVPVSTTETVLTEPPWGSDKVDAIADADRLAPLIAQLRAVVGDEAAESQLVTIVRAADYDLVRSLKYFFASGQQVSTF